MHNKIDFMIANIVWNPNKWKEILINPETGYDNPKKQLEHGSMNDKFDEKKPGFIQVKDKPVNFSNNGIIILYTTNTDKKTKQIVGIYTNANVLKEPKSYSWTGFDENIYNINIQANKDLSMVFPLYLNANKYEHVFDNKYFGRYYSYHDISLAKMIIKDELIELKKSGSYKNELRKLKNIYSYITNNKCDFKFLNSDEIEQQELIDYYSKDNSKEKLIEDLKNAEAQESQSVIVEQKSYKRDNKTIAQLKLYRDFKCQICGTQIRKKEGDFYIEVAHIKPKLMNGSETPDNILILCPNHHKEFDYGKLEILNHSKDNIEFELNERSYKIDLRII